MYLNALKAVISKNQVASSTDDLKVLQRLCQVFTSKGLMPRNIPKNNVWWNEEMQVQMWTTGRL